MQMSALENHPGEETELVFGSRTIFVPGRSVEIGYSVRKKSAFPLVEELVLKLLNVIGSASLSDIAGFVDLPAKDLRTVLQPLLGKGLVIQRGDDFELSEVGRMLFLRSDDDTPVLTELESRVHRFTIDDECALPVVASDFSEHLAMAKGGLKRLIDDLRQAPNAGDELLSRVRRNFGEYFAHFMRNEGDLEKIKEEQLELHKTEYAKTRSSCAVAVDVQGVIRSNGVVVNRVLPLDTLSAKPESRMAMRNSLIDAAKGPLDDRAAGEIEFLRSCFGDDFLDGIAANGALPWFKVMPLLFRSNRTILRSGGQVMIGELSVPRNLFQIDALFQAVTAGKEFSSEAPLRISWLRPSVGSWGRSIAFLDGVKALREISGRLRKGAVVLELWENRVSSDVELEPNLRHYWPWFDDVRYFRDSEVPKKMEMILIGKGAGIAVTHAFTPPQACFPCPVGVAFSENETIRNLVSERIEPNLRSLPKPIKRPKKAAKKVE